MPLGSISANGNININGGTITALHGGISSDKNIVVTAGSVAAKIAGALYAENGIDCVDAPDYLSGLTFVGNN